MWKKVAVGCLVVFVVVVVLGGVGIYFLVTSPEFKKAFSEQYSESFLTSYRASFVESCKGENPPNAEFACPCMADYLVKNYTAKELTELSLKGQAAMTESGPIVEAVKHCLSVEE